MTKYEPGHTEHTDDCMSEWGENARRVMTPETVAANHRLHIHDVGIHTDCPPSCEIGNMWDEAVSTDDRLSAFDIKRKAHRCPVCDAAPGQNCVSQTEGEVRWIHWSRYLPPNKQTAFSSGRREPVRQHERSVPPAGQSRIWTEMAQMRRPGQKVTYVPDNPETDEAMVLSGYGVGILQMLRTTPEPLYDVIVVDGPFVGTRTTANESDFEDLS